MGKDLCDQLRIFDTGQDSKLAATIRTAFNVDRTR
jgi:hypothetical protein